MLQRFSLSVLFLCFLSLALTAQESTVKDLRFDRISSESGLSNSSVSSIVQDKRGFLWFGTQGGLNRWNGYEFTIFENDPYDITTLSHNLVQTLYLEKEADILWVGTYRGLNRIDLKTEKVTRFLNQDDAPNSLSNNVVVSILRDRDGTLWVGTLSGLNRMRQDGISFDRFLNNPQNPATLINNTVRALTQDLHGRVWVGTGSGLDLWWPESQGFQHVYRSPDKTVMSIQPTQEGTLWLGVWGLGLVLFDPDQQNSKTIPLSENKIYTVREALNQKILIGTWGGGLTVYDPDTGEQKTYRHDSDKPDSLAYDVVYSIFQDNGGILWIGTNGNGISKYDPHKKDFRYLIHNPKDEHSLSFGKVMCLYEDRSNTLWIGINNGGLNQLNDKTGKITRYLHDKNNPASLSNNIVNTILEDRQGRLWIGTNSGLNLMDRQRQTFQTFSPQLTPKMRLSDDIIYSLFQDLQGRLWVGTYRSGINVYDEDLNLLKQYRHDPKDVSSLCDDMIYKIHQDKKGQIWVATNKGLARLQKDETGFINYQNNPQNLQSLSSDTIRDLMEDEKGRIWIATIAGGLNLYNPVQDNFKHFTKTAGLPNNNILGVMEGKQNKLYISTQKGLSILDQTSQLFTNLGPSDGLEVQEFTQGRGKRRDGRLLFGSIKGVYQFDDQEYLPHVYRPPVYITDFQVFNKNKTLEQPLNFTKSIAISYQENYITLNFAALDYSVPEQNQYAYKLSGFDKEWINAGTRRWASYTNLPAGEYEFLVKGANSAGIWNEIPTSLTIKVIPPFWETLPFRILVPLLAVLSVGLYFSYRVRRVKLINRVLEEKVTSRTYELNEANERLHKLNQTKDKFFSIIAHDLRNPFTGLIGLAEYLAEEQASPEEMAAYTKEMRRALENYYELLENLLKWTRLQTGGLEIHEKPLFLSLEIERILCLLEPTAKNKGLSLEYRSSDPIVISTDSDMLASLLQNLVFNAIKFTQRGGIVTIQTRVSSDPSLAEITIDDNGIGMKPETLAKLFRADIKMTTPGTELEKGTGLGLLLCKELVEKMGGSIQVSSDWGRGSRFIILLPIAPSNL